MMNKFLKKEIRLCLSPINYLFLTFCVMMMIPNYPRYVSLFYICLGTFFVFNNGEINKDIQYSLILPIKKSDMVKSRCILIFSYEVIFMILSVPFAWLSAVLNPAGNAAGIEGNVAFFGLGMISLTVFHFIMFSKFYKRAEKPGLPFLFASMGFWISFLIFEIPVYAKDIVNLPFLKILDSTAKPDQIKQIPVLAAGILIYGLGWLLTFKKSSSNFEKVDL